MELSKFRNDLEKRLESLQIDNPRPFICKGSPLDCTVFIIGINPATESNDFWHYWNDKIGFDYNNWFEAYKKSRRERKKREISNTRRNLNIINEELAKEKIKVLETNLYTKATARAKELQDIDKNTKILDFLLQTIKPKLLVTHGKDVKKAMNIKIGKDLDLSKEKFTEVTLHDIKLDVFPIQHLSYQFSKEKAENLSQIIVERLKSQ